MKGRSWPTARPGPGKVPVATRPGVRPTGPRPASPGQVRPGQKVAQPGLRPPGSAGAAPGGPRPVQARPGQQIAVKRPGEATAGPGGVIKKPPVPATATGKDAPKLSVTSQSKTDDIGIQTLVGDYAEKGTNHNKKFYQKLQKIPGHEDIKAKTDTTTLDLETIASTATGSFDGALSSDGDMKSSDGLAEAPAASSSVFRRGGIFPTAICLSKAAIGAGVLSVAAHSAEVGALYQFICLVFGGVLTVVSIRMISTASIETQRWSFEDICEELFHPAMSFFTGFVNVCNCLGAAATYLI
ncbi:unnamed protein product, partial [Cladocopium goreaui]